MPNVTTTHTNAAEGVPLFPQTHRDYPGGWRIARVRLYTYADGEATRYRLTRLDDPTDPTSWRRIIADYRTEQAAFRHGPGLDVSAVPWLDGPLPLR